ncbi:hypothetical protein [Paenibacillus alvei]|uniref:hypothetical protein n=1 Tax=Paenibacillus alvei TaxID=44250 RepID=UPI001F507CAC|nr:hypothetical protein [Paenibacillus alvei]MCY9577715.1 hypothetical protein [Paenibacillus alvei]MCY9583082.1 hypothetical protein [Paenibacillus alvei]
MLIKRIFLSIYLIVITVLGVLKVPVTVVWGKEMKHEAKEFVPLWELQSKQKVGEFFEFYQLDYLRLLFELGIATLIVFALYLIFKPDRIKDAFFEASFIFKNNKYTLGLSQAFEEQVDYRYVCSSVNSSISG